jgi:two-component system response regulator DegU
MNKRVDLAIVDDHLLFRKGLISLLKEFDDFNMIVEASSGEEFFKKIRKKKPDVVLLDMEMPGMSGIEITEILTEKYPEIKILMLSMHNEPELIFHLIEKGAGGYLLKDHDIKMIVNGIHSVVETGYYFNDCVSKVKGLMKSNKIDPAYFSVNLTEREVEIVKLICKEYTNKEIATKLCISARTVDGHREKILQKTKAKNTVGIVMYAVKNKLVN